MSLCLHDTPTEKRNFSPFGGEGTELSIMYVGCMISFKYFKHFWFQIKIHTLIC